MENVAKSLFATFWKHAHYIMHTYPENGEKNPEKPTSYNRVTTEL